MPSSNPPAPYACFDLASNACPMTACLQGQRGSLVPSGADNSGTEGTFLLSGWTWTNTKGADRHGGLQFAPN